ncbi:hypothetical protein VA7868_02355 [Vibrio aerogenes CECT 7868]|uniref:Uncharacterized protein n=3 Tax=Vibrio aerogenes TaxID=92172 RepID=A0A1M5Z6R0_9VIBR|nr:hypothetical protein [Vibrio aerogenes]SHI19844.1 hypothetical protein VA7868_02355 [Vibrio aerogenes CECT 7868]
MSDPKTCSVSAAPDSDERSWHTLAWSEPEWSELKQSEQQLAAALYQLGLVLSEQSDAAQITAAQTYQLNALEGLLQTPHWKLLIRHFSLKDAEAALLAVVFLFQLEPDLLAVYSGLSWYEQGPGISAERALSLIPATQGDDFPSNRVNLVLPDCPLIQHGLLIGQDPENPLHQPLNVAGALLALMNRAYSQSTAYETSQAWLSRAACLSGPAASVVYQHQFSMPSAGINVIHAEAQDYREKSAFIQALLQSSASQDDETVLWRLHGVQEYHQATPMIRQALLAARLSTLAATQALYWPTLAEDCDTSEALRVLAGWLIASPQILLFCDQSAAPHTSGQPSGLSLGTEATTSSWFVHTIRCYPVQRFYLQTTTQQRAKGWQALI